MKGEVKMSNKKTKIGFVALLFLLVFGFAIAAKGQRENREYSNDEEKRLQERKWEREDRAREEKRERREKLIERRRERKGQEELEEEKPDNMQLIRRIVKLERTVRLLDKRLSLVEIEIRQKSQKEPREASIEEQFEKIKEIEDVNQTS